MATLPLRAHVKSGRLVLDEPTDLPDGTIVELLPFEDDLDAEDRARLNAALDRGIDVAARGDTYSADEVIAHIRARG